MKRTNALFILLLLLIPLTFCDVAEARSLLKVAFLDVGQGDAIYIAAPNGSQMVIDGGPAGSLSGPLSEVMPFGDRSINVLMVTHPDSDHYAGFSGIMETYAIGAVVGPGVMSDTSSYASFQKSVAEKHIPEIRPWKGMTVELDKDAGVKYTVLFPDRDVSGWETNEGSTVGILSYGKTRIMLTGDTGKRSEGLILATNPSENLRSDILKVAHHGSTTSSLDAFVKAVGAKWAVISAGYKNKYGLPKQVTLDTLARNKAEIIRTDEVGTIVFTSDGKVLTRAE